MAAALGTPVVLWECGISAPRLAHGGQVGRWAERGQGVCPDLTGTRGRWVGGQAGEQVGVRRWAGR